MSNFALLVTMYTMMSCTDQVDQINLNDGIIVPPTFHPTINIYRIIFVMKISL